MAAKHHARQPLSESGLGGWGLLERFLAVQHVFSPDILRPVWRGLLEQSALREVISTRFGTRLTPALIRVVDSTMWKVVPRIRWAHYWRGQHGWQQKAVRLACEAAPRQPAQPTAAATPSTGKRCERTVLCDHSSHQHTPHEIVSQHISGRMPVRH